ncbi:hypothetical protein FQN57_003228 [Myotisia sp. PD_48]|nr:hypothetical protein FQN57_003228 [Myotisia sp. PD_48]
MQTIWGRAPVRPFICRCSSCLKHATFRGPGQAVSPASRRRLLIGNGITGFYATIFATAMAWDTTEKNKRRLEWQRELEAVKAEVEQFRDEEIRRVAALTARRKYRSSSSISQKGHFTTYIPTKTPANPFYHSRRMFTQAAGPEPEPLASSPSTIIDPDLDYESEINTKSSNSLYFDGVEVGGDPVSLAEVEQYERDLSLNDVLRKRAILRLGAQQLAIKLILRPAVAHLYSNVPFDSRTSCVLPEISIEKLLEELDHIRKRIAKIRWDNNAWFGDLASDITLTEHERLKVERQTLDVALRELYFLHENEGFSSSELLIKVAENLLGSEEPVSQQTVSLLIRMFSRLRQNDVVNLVMDSLFSNGLTMGNGVILSTLDFFNKSKDLNRFDRFLKKLQAGKTLLLPNIWHPVTVGDLEVISPPFGHRSRSLFNNLVAAALGFNQPHRAHAWLSISRDRGNRDTPSVFGIFLRYYSERQDWEKGSQVLLDASKYIMTTVTLRDTSIERLILYMAAFCNSCGKQQEAQKIIEKAARNGISWEDAHNPTDERIVILSTLQQWRSATDLDSFDDVPVSKIDRYKAFARDVQDILIPAVSAIEWQRTLYTRSVDQVEDSINDSRLNIRDLQFEVQKVQHRLEMRNLHLEMSRPGQIDALYEKVHSLELKMRDLALDVERTCRQIEISALQRQMSKLQFLFHASPADTHTSPFPLPETRPSLSPKKHKIHSNVPESPKIISATSHTNKTTEPKKVTLRIRTFESKAKRAIYTNYGRYKV